MFRAFGHPNISVLNGGLPEWIRKGYETVNNHENESLLGDFIVSNSVSGLKNYNEILENTQTEEFLLIDARSSGRFNGTENEPRKSLRSGNIPNSINIPYSWVLENGLFKSKDALIEAFKSIEKESRGLIFSCGSGVTACIVLLASELVMENEKYVFDGSWTEWATRQNLLT